MLREHVYLYVEDDPFSRDVMRLIAKTQLKTNRFYMFEDSGCFEERLGALPEAPDVFLLDIHLKPVDGFALLRKVRENPTYAGACVVALTASVMNEEVERLREAGFDGAIAKPLNLTTLSQVLRTILEGQAVWHIGE